jgi:DNA integrity scanning protein DisA with diadenylate cyclase activity
MLLLLPYTEYLGRLGEPRNIADIIIVFLVVYAVLKLVRGTRAAPMAAGIGAFALLYWLACRVVADVNRSDQIQRAETLKVWPATSQDNFHSPGRIVTYIQIAGPD